MQHFQSSYNDTEQISCCDLCGGDSFSPVRKCREPENAAVPEMAGGREFVIVRCDECMLHMVSPRYSYEKLEKLYGEKYFTGVGQFALARTAYWSADGRLPDMRFGAELLKERGRKGTVLDAGCGAGGFADALGAGWQVSGIEWSEFAAQYARDNSACVDVVA